MSPKILSTESESNKPRVENSYVVMFEIKEL